MISSPASIALPPPGEGKLGEHPIPNPLESPEPGGSPFPESRVRLAALHEAKRQILDQCSPGRGGDGFWWFLTRMVKTKDEKDGGRVKLFPSKEYLRDLAYLFLECAENRQPLLLAKSRQMLLSWLAVSYLVWRCCAKPNQLWLWQSKKLEDAAAMIYCDDDPLVARASFIAWNLPNWVFPRPNGSYGSLVWPNGSKAMAVAQGPDVIRSYSASGIISDEMGFQEQAGAAYTAAKPSIDGGGQFIGISSANAGFFWDMVEDRG